MLNFDFLKNCLGIVSPPYFVHDFFNKNFFMLYPIPGRDVISFEIELFSNQAVTKKARQKLGHLKNEKSF